MPRVASRQIFCASAESYTPFQYYLKNVCYPLLDHLIQGVDNRFDKYGSTVYLMYGLISSVIVETMTDILQPYHDYLPMLINAEKEFFRWKGR